jgi:dolichol-phosphate mannosyltransferase
MKKAVDIIIPAFNEEECLIELAKRLNEVFKIEKEYDFKVFIIEFYLLIFFFNSLELFIYI